MCTAKANKSHAASKSSATTSHTSPVISGEATSQQRNSLAGPSFTTYLDESFLLSPVQSSESESEATPFSEEQTKETYE